MLKVLKEDKVPKVDRVLLELEDHKVLRADKVL